MCSSLYCTAIQKNSEHIPNPPSNILERLDCIQSFFSFTPISLHSHAMTFPAPPIVPPIVEEVFRPINIFGELLTLYPFGFSLETHTSATWIGCVTQWPRFWQKTEIIFPRNSVNYTSTLFFKCNTYWLMTQISTQPHQHMNQVWYIYQRRALQRWKDWVWYSIGRQQDIHTSGWCNRRNRY